MTEYTLTSVDTEDGPLRVVHEGVGPHVVLLHPGALDLTVWDEMAAELAENNHVVRFDARSHGESATAHRDHHPLDDLLRVLDALSINRAHLIGCSMGAVLAAEAAILAPQRVNALTLIGGEVWPAEDDQDPFLAECEGEMAIAIEKGDGARWIDAMVRLSVDGPMRAPDDVSPALRARIAVLLGNAVRRHAAATGQQLWASVRHRLAEIDVPTLVLVGELDNAAVKATAELIEREVDDARRVLVKGVGHLTMLEAHQITMAEVHAHRTRLG